MEQDRRAKAQKADEGWDPAPEIIPLQFRRGMDTARVTDKAAVAGEEYNNRKEAAMPRGDKTGPMGAGPMSGRGAGFCNGFQTAGFQNTGRGFGCGRAFGFRRFAQPAQSAPTSEIDALKEQMNRIEQKLKELLDRS